MYRDAMRMDGMSGLLAHAPQKASALSAHGTRSCPGRVHLGEEHPLQAPNAVSEYCSAAHATHPEGSKALPVCELVPALQCSHVAS